MIKSKLIGYSIKHGVAEVCKNVFDELECIDYRPTSVLWESFQLFKHFRVNVLYKIVETRALWFY